MTSLVDVAGMGVQGIEEVMRAKRSKRFKRVPRLLGSREQSRYWLFREANLTVEPGDVVLVVADPPLAATAFMRSLCGLLLADEGSVSTRGRSLMLAMPRSRALSGLSVRQTVFMLGGLYGVPDSEVEALADRVIEMAEVGDLLGDRIEDSPRKVKVQIAFAWGMLAPVDLVAIQGEPIMGDADFRRGCAGHLADLKAQGRGLVIMTRDLALAKSLCTKAIILDKNTSTTTTVAEARAELRRRAKAKKQARRAERRRRKALAEEPDAPQRERTDRGTGARRAKAHDARRTQRPRADRPADQPGRDRSAAPPPDPAGQAPGAGRVDGDLRA